MPSITEKIRNALSWKSDTYSLEEQSNNDGKVCQINIKCKLGGVYFNESARTPIIRRR